MLQNIIQLDDVCIWMDDLMKWLIKWCYVGVSDGDDVMLSSSSRWDLWKIKKERKANYKRW